MTHFEKGGLRELDQWRDFQSCIGFVHSMFVCVQQHNLDMN